VQTKRAFFKKALQDKEKERKEAFCLSFFAVFLDETKALCYNKYHKTFLAKGNFLCLT
jgi:hypothetical protein